MPRIRGRGRARRPSPRARGRPPRGAWCTPQTWWRGGFRRPGHGRGGGGGEGGCGGRGRGAVVAAGVSEKLLKWRSPHRDRPLAGPPAGAAGAGSARASQPSRGRVVMISSQISLLYFCDFCRPVDPRRPGAERLQSAPGAGGECVSRERACRGGGRRAAPRARGRRARRGARPAGRLRARARARRGAAMASTARGAGARGRAAAPAASGRRGRGGAAAAAAPAAAAGTEPPQDAEAAAAAAWRPEERPWAGGPEAYQDASFVLEVRRRREGRARAGRDSSSGPWWRGRQRGHNKRSRPASTSTRPRPPGRGVDGGGRGARGVLRGRRRDAAGHAPGARQPRL
jgi:hypothetical protein